MMRCAHYTPYVSEVAMGHAKKRARAIAYGKRLWGGQSNMSLEHNFVGLGLFLSFVLFGVCLFTDFGDLQHRTTRASCILAHS